MVTPLLRQWAPNLLPAQQAPPEAPGPATPALGTTLLPSQVCDFGLAHLKLDSGVLTQRMGSPMWTAPEVLKGESRDETADTYSYGMLLFEMLTCRLPYHDHAPAQVAGGHWLLATHGVPRTVTRT